MEVSRRETQKTTFCVLFIFLSNLHYFSSGDNVLLLRLRYDLRNRSLALIKSLYNLHICTNHVIMIVLRLQMCI